MPDCDQLNMTSTVTLDGALNVSLINSFVPNHTDSFTIINNDGADPVIVTFTSLPQGANINVGGNIFRISYTGGDGNDVVL